MKEITWFCLGVTIGSLLAAISWKVGIALVILGAVFTIVSAEQADEETDESEKGPQ